MIPPRPTPAERFEGDSRSTAVDAAIASGVAAPKVPQPREGVMQAQQGVLARFGVAESRNSGSRRILGP